MRVLFVWLNNDSPVGFSHGLAVLSRELKQAGHEVSLIHVNERMGTPWDREAIGETVARARPDVVGLSFGTNAWAAAELAEEARRRVPGCRIIAGGVHATLNPEEVIAWQGVDLVAVGEADDYRLVRVLEGLWQDRLPEGMAGFWYRRGDDVVRNPIAPPVDLEAEPRPMDLRLFDHQRIIALKRGYADAISGRGCPHHCSYCHNSALRGRYLRDLGLTRPSELRYVRKRKVEDVLAELGEYRALYGDQIKVFSFTDDVFITSKAWLFSFLDAYRERFDVPLVFCSTISHVDEEVARRCARAGVYMVRIGVESGSARLREQVMRRPYRAKAIERAVRSLQRAGVNVLTFNMLGVPTETMRDVWSTFRFAARLRSDAHQFSIFWPYPGTPLHAQCIRQGLLASDASFRGNYLSTSPLRWPSRRRRFYERIRSFYALAVNRFVAPSSIDSDAFAALLGEIGRMDEATWRDGGATRIQEQATLLALERMAAGEHAYITPFADRPDILLLQTERRVRKLINV